MAQERDSASLLARRLRELREQTWPQVNLTQAQLATAFSGEAPVKPATISGWESPTSPKRPTATRLEAYARFFATRGSVEGDPHLVAEAELDEEEREGYLALRGELLGLADNIAHEPEVTRRRRGGTFVFDEGPVTVICSEVPQDVQGSLAQAKSPDYTKLQQYGDLDALIEMYGHLRAFNTSLDVFHRVAGDVVADDLSTHVILLGGIAWNQVTKRFQEAIRQVPITQVEGKDYDPFEVEGGKRYDPEWETDENGERELVEDVALLARLRNPFNSSRTLTICNGVHSRGVLGAVRCLTDRRVREANEEYLAQRFPERRFAVLLRVPVVRNETLSPDLQNPTARLFEWPLAKGARG